MRRLHFLRLHSVKRAADGRGVWKTMVGTGAFANKTSPETTVKGLSAGASPPLLAGGSAVGLQGPQTFILSLATARTAWPTLHQQRHTCLEMQRTADAFPTSFVVVIALQTSRSRE